MFGCSVVTIAIMFERCCRSASTWLHDYLHKHANKPVACNYLNKAPYSIAIIVLDQSTVNMKGVLAILFAACILFKATEAAPSSNYHQIAVEDK